MESGPSISAAIITSTLFLAVAAVIIARIFYRYKHYNSVLDSLKELSRNGTELPQDMIAVVGLSTDLRRATRLLIISVSCVFVSYIFSTGDLIDARDAQEIRLIMLSVSVFTGLTGLSHLAFHIFRGKV